MSYYLDIDKVDYHVLKNLYQHALDNGQDQFQFKGRAVLVNYAKYLIQYLDSKFEKES
jgi:hypothetical protein